ncbi:MAG: hypothetical protein A3F84_24255 [Candidatus Handelsmanbacteria bacterium RIFCSPLOWO2_12_FULL_64_10]|uniref:Addiction module toxin RelE n=1 Tax=Handelsmanbacteria sp. (strain RIFCSPLOWO2_12_FULL_64_10) TaxID=1817868 RepID=A0A1F6CPE9_HANXR|nr:MAG: hypothetical protein A3F84_24255 [Candidatus Handelsmanbacteria bacterium RIFCSPLOWO2_12_FULL_64_10]
MQHRRVEILPSFQEAYDALSSDVQERVSEALAHFTERTADNALRPEMKNGFDNVWGIRVTNRYRAFYKKFRDSDGAIFCMFHVGHHDDYRVLKKLAARVSFTTQVRGSGAPSGQDGLRVTLQAHYGGAAKPPKR